MLVRALIFIIPFSLIFALLSYIYANDVSKFSVFEPCEDVGEGGFCERRYFDDGFVELRSQPSEKNHCCIMTRDNLSTNVRGYRVLACDFKSEQSLNCSSVDSFRMDKWIVDGVQLSTDLIWGNHETIFIHKGEK